MKRILLWFLLFEGLLLPCWSQEKPTVYAFLPSNLRPHALQSLMNREAPEVDIVFFGRFREFEVQVLQNKPDAVLTYPMVVEYLSQSENLSYKPLVTGIRAEKRVEPLMLMSVDRQIEVTSIDQTAIGVVSLMGRRQMGHFLADKFKVGKISIKTVTKLEDLLSLLQFEDVDAILVPESRLDYYKQRSKLNLVITPLPDVSYRLPILYVGPEAKEEDQKALREAFGKMEKGVINLLGVDQWQTP
ncbi:hypothetical protein [Acanthopleuribacter pedis]|uniref:Uncharacterized protein n=1 Tax=Acanthopleuribacter pedis TaxID=442870 RepID=A0A8J7Q714_9BACT|nr:hypothetical protein [Acanthopleuribacter pedis]MBO1319032.1 hypothetical protein [Acanthopleuribacter pedis]